MSHELDDPAEQPDDLSPEWTAYEAEWSILGADFPNPILAAQFLSRRKEIFRSAEKAGIPREMLSLFEPNKPGFEDRVSKALSEFARGAGLAAE